MFVRLKKCFTRKIPPHFTCYQIIFPYNNKKDIREQLNTFTASKRLRY